MKDNMPTVAIVGLALAQIAAEFGLSLLDLRVSAEQLQATGRISDDQLDKMLAGLVFEGQALRDAIAKRRAELEAGDLAPDDLS